MQPTQADTAVAASALNDMLKRQKDCLDRQIKSLDKIEMCLRKMEQLREDNNPYGDLFSPLAEFVGAHADSLSGQSSGMASAIAHNQRLIESMQSNIVVPGLHQKLRNM